MTEEQQPAQSNEERALAVIDTSLANYKAEFRRLLGNSVDPEVFMSVAYEAYRSNRDLLQIALTAPDSLMKALHDAAALKLVPNGVLGSAYIVPRRNKNTGRMEAHFQVGYRGLEELIMRSGFVSTIQSRIVYQNESFAISYGTNPGIDHTPILDGADRGPVRGVYAVARMRDGNSVFEYMTVEQVNAIRDRSPSKSGPWSTDYEEMTRKTAVRRLAKALPMSVDIQRAIAADDAGETGEVVATVSAPEPQAASLAGRIRQTMGKAEPKNVTPDAEAPVSDEPAGAESGSATTPEPEPTETAQEPTGQPEKPAARPRRKKAAEPEPEPESASDDVPDEPAVEPAPKGSGKFGSMVGSSQTWQGMIFAKGDSIRLKHFAEDAPWTGKLITDDADVQSMFDSLDDRAWSATVAGELELVPWERDGQAMPPFRQITVRGIEVGQEMERPA
jgi:recombination protein RecT